MNINKSNIIFFIYILIIFLSSCSYVGRTIGMDHPLLCRCQTFPIACIQPSGIFIVEYNISELNEANKYFVEGSATYTGSIGWEFYKGALFTLFLVENGVIVETVSVAGGHGSSDRTIKFAREFTAQNKFEAVLINLRIKVYR